MFYVDKQRQIRHLTLVNLLRIFVRRTREEEYAERIPDHGRPLLLITEVMATVVVTGNQLFMIGVPWMLTRTAAELAYRERPDSEFRNYLLSAEPLFLITK
jgi:hypothetical protein